MKLLDYIANKFSLKFKPKEKKVTQEDVLPDYQKKFNASIIEMGFMNTGVFSPTIIKSSVDIILKNRSNYSKEIVDKALSINIDKLKTSKFGKNTLNTSKNNIS
jgi:hypothetical protein